MKRLHLIFKGNVQGVGFRYEATRIAHSLQLSGWVKNLPDLSVEAEVQGNPEDIDSLIDQIRSTKRFRMKDITSNNIPLKSNESGFEVVY